MQNKWIIFLTTAWLVGGEAGCASPGLFKFSKNDFPKAGPKHPVSQIVGVWQPAMGSFENKSVRGFSGQILFFCQGNEQPVQVDGDVRIYVFDDQGTPDQQIQPLHEVDFEAKAWNQLLSKGPLGATYNVFIPYIRPGNHEAKCTLRVRYLPKGGTPTYSEMVNICLEGKKKAVPADASATDYDAARAGRSDSGKSVVIPEHEVASGKTAQARNLTDTISVPDEARASRPPRHAVTELTDEERTRIIREARARLKAETGSDVALVIHGESTAEREPVARQSTRRPQADPSVTMAGQDDWDEDETSESAEFNESTTPVVRRRSPAGAHVLDDEQQASVDDHGRAVASGEEEQSSDDDEPALE